MDVEFEKSRYKAPEDEIESKHFEDPKWRWYRTLGSKVFNLFNLSDRHVSHRALKTWAVITAGSLASTVAVFDWKWHQVKADAHKEVQTLSVEGADGFNNQIGKKDTAKQVVKSFQLLSPQEKTEFVESILPKPLYDAIIAFQHTQHENLQAQHENQTTYDHQNSSGIAAAIPSATKHP